MYSLLILTITTKLKKYIKLQTDPVLFLSSDVTGNEFYPLGLNYPEKCSGYKYMYMITLSIETKQLQLICTLITS